MPAMTCIEWCYYGCLLHINPGDRDAYDMVLSEQSFGP